MRKFNLKGKVAQKLKGVVMEAETGDGAPIPVTGDGEPSPVAAESLRTTWRTDTGRLRRNNQDAVIAAEGLYGVADGMGGHNGGEIASGELRDGLVREISGKEPEMETLRLAVEKVNLELWERQEHDAALTGMGTTLTAIWPSEREMIIAHVGDSRAYLFRKGEMTQVTSDHSMVADMVRRGILTEEQAACHPMRNYITRAVGTEDTIEVDMLCFPREAGDRWLICSDGLHGMTTKTELKRLGQIENPEEAADRLLQAALDGGGRDNISLVILDDAVGAAEKAEETQEAGETEETDAQSQTPDQAILPTDQEGGADA